MFSLDSDAMFTSGGDSSVNQDVTKEDADAMLAHDLNALSLQERNQVYEEIHGVESTIHETAEMLELALNNLEFELSDRRRRNQIYYDLIQQLPATTIRYLSSSRFRLQFLRAENFDVEKTATRMVNYILYVRDMFGAHCLGRPLVMEDLDKDDLMCLKAGTFQILPNRDVAGRIVYMHRPQDKIEDRVSGREKRENPFRKLHASYVPRKKERPQGVVSRRCLLFFNSSHFDSLFFLGNMDTHTHTVP